MKQKVKVMFTETVLREREFEIEVEDHVDLQELGTPDVHEMLDRQKAWDQLSKEDWLTGAVESRQVDDVTWFAFGGWPDGPRPDGPETLEGGLIGQQPY
jgi:hypothetical protein